MRPQLPTSRANADSIAEYEELRARVLAGPTSGSHLDIRLLIREGVAAWMTRYSSAQTLTPVPLVEPAQRPADPKVVTDELRAGLVRGLASMALAIRREVSP